MDEEGTVVYFKTSPICELKDARDLHEDEELVYREEWDASNSEAASVGDDSRFPTAYGRDRVVSAAEPPNAVGVVWTGIGVLLTLFGGVWVAGKRWLHPADRSDKIVRYKDKLLDCIGNSPLLTEDDFQLVQFIVTNCQTHCSLTTPHAQWQNYHYRHPRNRHTVVFFLAFLVGLTAIAAATVPIQYSFVLTTLVIVMGGVPLAIRWRMKLAVEQRLEKSVNTLQTYLREFETLLSLVTQSIRLIRETEIIAHGFSRPSNAVPIGKLELQGSTDLQCPLLRKKLFSICQDGIHSLRRVAQQLCTKFTTKEEFDSHGGYLAFRDLSALHQFMRDDSETVTDQVAKGEMKNAPSFETLESLKDASNLLAVQNSELLKRLAMVIGFAAESCQNESSLRTLMAAMETVSPLHVFLHEASDSLRWSVDFHKNYLFGEPPTPKREATMSEGAVAHPLETTVHEVHCMDLKTQVALQRIRALGLWLNEEGETVTPESVESLRQQLSTIENDLCGIVDHVAVCFQSLDTKPGDILATLDSTHTKGEATDFTEGEEALTQVAYGVEEEGSDDEMVFEAYVSPSDVAEDQDDLPLNGEDVKSLKESKENSIHMLKELNSVLAVRNVEKQRRRELRERKKQGGPTGATLVSHSQPPADQEMTNNIQEKPVAMGCSQDPGVPVQEEVAPIIQIAEGDLKGKALVDDEQPSPEKSVEGLENESHKFDLPLNLPSREEQWGNAVLNSSAIAQAVAAIALRTGRANEEEFFHDDQDSSSTTSEAEADQP